MTVPECRGMGQQCIVAGLVVNRITVFAHITLSFYCTSVLAEVMFSSYVISTISLFSLTRLT